MVGIVKQVYGIDVFLDDSERPAEAKLALELSYRRDDFESRKDDDRHALAKLKARLQVGTIIYRPSYGVDYYEIVSVEAKRRYSDDVYYTARPIHSAFLGNVSEYWADDRGFGFWLSDVYEEYSGVHRDGMPGDFIIAAKNFSEIEPFISDKFPSDDLRDTGMVEYLRKTAFWRLRKVAA